MNDLLTKNVIKISLDGNKWCALIGEDLENGIAVFADSPQEALSALLDGVNSGSLQWRGSHE